MPDLLVNLSLGSGLALLLLFALNLAVLTLARLWGSPRPVCGTSLDEGDLPTVLVQLPLYNEGELVHRILGAVAALDWPRDRLEVQVLDDSTDGSVALSQQAVSEWRGRGLRVQLLHRHTRTGYKAGALAAGLQHSDAPFVAIFDADFIPPPDFLRRSLGVLLADPACALVQGRWGHLNRDENLLTRIQARLLDAHFVVEQEARWRLGLPVPFNGTGGVWRRAAIDDAGGWAGDTLTEDLDLSLRASLRGWRGTYLFDLVTPATLPPSARAWLSQQYRWTKGFAQCFLKLLPSVWRSPCLPLWQKLLVSLQMGQSFVFLVGTGCILAALPLLSDLATPAMALAPQGLAVSVFGPLATVSFLATGAREHPPRALWEVPAALLLTSGLLVSNARAALEALVGHPSEFIRTPKTLPAQGSGIRRGWMEVLAGTSLLTFLLVEEPLAVAGLMMVIAGLLTLGLLQLRDGEHST